MANDDALKVINDALVTLITNTPSSSIFDGFSSVLAYPPKIEDLTGSPICFVVPTRIDSEITTNIENERTYIFSAYIYVQMDTNATRSGLNQQMQYTVGSVMKQLDKNWSSANWDKLTTSMTSWLIDSGDYVVTTLQIEAYKITNIS